MGERWHLPPAAHWALRIRSDIRGGHHSMWTLALFQWNFLVIPTGTEFLNLSFIKSEAAHSIGSQYQETFRGDTIANGRISCSWFGMIKNESLLYYRLLSNWTKTDNRMAHESSQTLCSIRIVHPLQSSISFRSKDSPFRVRPAIGGRTRKGARWHKLTPKLFACLRTQSESQFAWSNNQWNVHTLYILPESQTDWGICDRWAWP
jgi:hypothetical protein